ncbi:MAG: NAD(P)-binding protein [Paracoccaceae bacterium]|nr:NAD(P)-binding protein [Paracoccaceae bacterium]
MTGSRYDILFEPVTIGPVTAPNRFYAVPHATGHGWTQPAGAIALRGMKAEGGWGTVAVQITEIAPDFDMANHPMERIWDDSDGLRHAAQVEAIKCHGSLAAIEIAHGGMRARNFTTGVPVKGPASLPVLRPEIPLQARAMDGADIRAFRAVHRAAAQRAREAGYDILYVYAAHDLSILSHFLSVRTNQRSDAYGGSLDNRLRLLREVLEDTLDVAAGDRAVALRFSVAEPSKPGGLRHDGEGCDVVEALAELPDLWDVNLSGWPEDSATARFAEEGFQLPFTDFVKSVTSRPVVGVGRFTSPDLMVDLVRKRRLDFIGAARPSIADPFLPSKIRNGRIEDIRECIGCNVCVSMDSYGVPIRCTQNPTISEEWRQDWHPEAPPVSVGQRSHLVIGAGPAGLECAVTLMRAGHKVTVADSATEAGGRTTREARLPGLANWARVRDFRLQQLLRSSDADLFLQSPMSSEDVLAFGADTVTLATGAKWRRDGVGSTRFDAVDFGETAVLTPDDVMDGRHQGGIPSKYVVYDDDHFYMASVVAEALHAAGHEVVYVTPLPEIATWTGTTLDQPRIIERLTALGIPLVPNVTLGANCRFTRTLDGERVTFGAFALALVGARSPRDSLHAELAGPDRPKELYRAGDCLAPGIIQTAVLSGHSTARRILDSGKRPGIPRREQVDVKRSGDPAVRRLPTAS